MWWSDLIDQGQPVFAACRAINPTLAVVALVMLGWRLGPAMLRYWDNRRQLTVYERQERDARLLFAGYLLASGLGAAQYIALDTPAGPVSCLLTVLHVMTGVVMFRWQSPLERTNS